MSASTASQQDKNQNAADHYPHFEIDQMLTKLKKLEGISLNSSNSSNIMNSYTKQFSDQAGKVYSMIQENTFNLISPPEFQIQYLDSQIEKMTIYNKYSQEYKELVQYQKKIDSHEELTDAETLRVLQILQNPCFIINNASKIATFQKIFNNKGFTPVHIYLYSIDEFYTRLGKEIMSILNFDYRISLQKKAAKIIKYNNLSDRFNAIGNNNNLIESRLDLFLREDNQKMITNQLIELKDEWNCDGKFDENVVYVFKKDFLEVYARLEFVEKLLIYYVLISRLQDENKINPQVYKALSEIINNPDFLPFELSAGFAGVNCPDEWFSVIFKILAIKQNHHNIENFIDRLIKLFDENKSITANAREKVIKDAIANGLDTKTEFKKLFVDFYAKFSESILESIEKAFIPIKKLLNNEINRKSPEFKECCQLIIYGPINRFIYTKISNFEFKNFDSAAKEKIVINVIDKLYNKIDVTYHQKSLLHTILYNQI